jgi:thiol-disulfide isomerase/thioredoxin
MKTRKLIGSSAIVMVMAIAFGFTFHQAPAERFSGVATTAFVDADSLNLKKYEGKVVVLNFWASWSKTSRSENKNIVRVYQKYKMNPKVVFVSVSLDTDKTSWKNAIEEDELSWSEQICDFNKWESRIATKYHVTTLPKTILIDTKGAIALSSARMIDLEGSIDGLIK